MKRVCQRTVGFRSVRTLILLAWHDSSFQHLVEALHFIERRGVGDGIADGAGFFG